MLSTCSLCGSSTRTIILHHGPEHYEIQPFANNFPIWSMIILDSYGMYNTFLHHIGFLFTVYIKNLYPMIVCFTHSFYKQSQKSLIMLKMVSFVVFFDFISYSQIFISSYKWRLSSNTITLFLFMDSQYILGLNGDLPYTLWWNIPSSISFL